MPLSLTAELRVVGLYGLSLTCRNCPAGLSRNRSAVPWWNCQQKTAGMRRLWTGEEERITDGKPWPECKIAQRNLQMTKKKRLISTYKLWRKNAVPSPQISKNFSLHFITWFYDEVPNGNLCFVSLFRRFEPFLKMVFMYYRKGPLISNIMRIASNVGDW